jgi:hypothetical protein
MFLGFDLALFHLFRSLRLGHHCLKDTRLKTKLNIPLLGEMVHTCSLSSGEAELGGL